MKSLHIDVPSISNATIQSDDVLNPLTSLPLTNLEGIVDLADLNIACASNDKAFDSIATMCLLVEFVNYILNSVCTTRNVSNSSPIPLSVATASPTFVCMILQRPHQRLIHEHPDKESICRAAGCVGDPARSMARRDQDSGRVGGMKDWAVGVCIVQTFVLVKAFFTPLLMFLSAFFAELVTFQWTHICCRSLVLYERLMLRYCEVCRLVYVCSVTNDYEYVEMVMQEKMMGT